MTAKIQMRRDTASNWSSNNPTLYEGEIGWDTTNNQIKIGTGALWNATGYLGSSLPSFSSSATDFDDASLRIQGRYYFANGSTMTNGPAAPMEIKAADGGVSLLVLVFGSVVVQRLWTDSDGTQPIKSYSRVYDTAWRTWIAENDFAVDGTEGTDLVARSLDIKENANVDGTLTVDGSVTLGDAAGDTVTVQPDTTPNPTIVVAGDTDTGIAFPAADKVSIDVGGAQGLLIDGTVTSALSAVFAGGATFNQNIDMSANKIVDLKFGVADGDSFPIQQLSGSLASTIVFANGAPLISIWGVSGLSGAVNQNTTDASGLVTWTVDFGSLSVPATIEPSIGKWCGLVITFNGTTLQTTTTISRSLPAVAGTPKQLFTGALATRYIAFMARVG